MKLSLSKIHGSLQPFEVELPDFTILTGLNGAGKTQILTGLAQQNLQLNDGEFNGLIKYIPSSFLSPSDGATILSSTFANRVQELWARYENFRNYQDKNPGALLEHHTNPTDLKLLQEIASSASKDVHHLDRGDLVNYYPMDDEQGNYEIFYIFFSEIFKKYKDKYTENEVNKFFNQQQGHHDTKYLSNEEFLAKWGEAPWNFLDRLNEAAGLNYAVHSPIEANKDLPFELTFKNKITGDEVKFYQLSSGEKAIMSLALALYNTNFEKRFPKVLLLDEADASLHPSMIKHLLSVIEKFFVHEKKLKVVLTTHSASTIALADEDSIYVVNPVGSDPRIEKTSKDKALKILTEGVPAFSVLYENRRQVFVESPYDVQFFERIYRSLSKHLNPEVSLSFVSSGDSRTDSNGIPVANCDQVVKITDTLRKFGNKFVWGIVDFDNRNKSSDSIKVLGEGQRYSIENYLFDPLLVGGLLLREKLVSRSDIGLQDEESLSDFKILPQERLQMIVDYVVNAVADYLKPSVGKSLAVELLDGRRIEIPDWYLCLQGHKLEEVLLKVFPALNGIKKGKEELLKLEILDKVMDDVPGIISVDFRDIFLEIQNS